MMSGALWCYLLHPALNALPRQTTLWLRLRLFAMLRLAQHIAPSQSARGIANKNIMENVGGRPVCLLFSGFWNKQVFENDDLKESGTIQVL
jgi:hypothetical protein